MAIPNAKSTTNSSFLYPYKDSQTKPGRQLYLAVLAQQNESHLMITSFSLLLKFKNYTLKTQHIS